MSPKELRELLEKAAKLLGYDTSHHWNAYRMTLNPPVAAMCISDVSTAWNPADDNGDSRHLQVALGIAVTPYPIYSMPKHSVIAKQYRKSDTLREANPTEVVEVYGDDPEAATRLAVLRCAAAVWDASQ